jgi:hypothetical protein
VGDWVTVSIEILKTGFTVILILIVLYFVVEILWALRK